MYYFQPEDISLTEKNHIAELGGLALNDDSSMNLAFKAAWKGVGQVSPNPLVGAVLVNRNGAFVHAAAHCQVGQGHAEANLIQEVKKKFGDDCMFKDAVLYVTLEPCAHYGRTPPCAEAIAKLPLRRLVYCVSDPNPQVSGKGLKLIEQAGIRVDQYQGSVKKNIEHQLAPFLWWIKDKKPFLAIKTATSLNGIAGFSGDQRAWITCERSRLYGHFLRMYYDAILVGSNTVKLDNPLLNIRLNNLGNVTDKFKTRFVLDGDGQLLEEENILDLNVFSQEPEKTIYLVSSANKKHDKTFQLLKKKGVVVVEIKPQSSTEQLYNLICKLCQERGLQSLLIEGGARVWSSFLPHSQKLHAFMANKIFLGENVFGSFTEKTKHNSSYDLKNIRYTTLESDFLIEASL